MQSLEQIEREAATAWFAERAGELACGDGQPAMVERGAPEGSMAPLSRRDEEEAYRVLTGEVTFFVDGDVLRAGAGDVVVAPGGAARTFRADSQGARWLVLTRVRDLRRFIDFGRAASAPLGATDEWPSQGELQAVASMAAANGIELLGPPGAIPSGTPAASS
jgi:quercetin dioxygenase-like cupin family protein